MIKLNNRWKLSLIRINFVENRIYLSPSPRESLRVLSFSALSFLRRDFEKEI